MVALYDYDPRESSPNIDVEVQAKCLLTTGMKPHLVPLPAGLLVNAMLNPLTVAFSGTVHKRAPNPVKGQQNTRWAEEK